MKHQIKYLHCGKHLKKSLKDEIDEVLSVVNLIEWQEEFKVIKPDSTLLHQTAYNKKFEIEFEKLGWEKKPLLSKNPKLIGDFRKNLVFVEVQFGNSATLYRDFYKFQYGLQHGLLSLSVLIVPVNPKEFFPTCPRSISSIAEYDLTLRLYSPTYFSSNNGDRVECELR